MVYRTDGGLEVNLCYRLCAPSQRGRRGQSAATCAMSCRSGVKCGNSSLNTPVLKSTPATDKARSRLAEPSPLPATERGGDPPCFPLSGNRSAGRSWCEDNATGTYIRATLRALVRRPHERYSPRMAVNVLMDQLKTATAVVTNATRGTDHVEVKRETSAALARESTLRNSWLVGSAELTGENQGYAVSLAQLTAGVITHAIVYVSSTGMLYTAALSEGAFQGQRPVVLQFRKNLELREIGWSVPPGERLAEVEESLTAFGYQLRPAQTAVLGLLDVLEGRSAGFVGHNVDVATRLAASLLISEAHGQIGDWSGRYPGVHRHSVATGSNILHYRRIAQLLAKAV